MFLRKLEQTFLFLVILFLPTQLGLHFWPDFTTVYSLPIDYLSPTIYFWDLLTLILIFIFLLQKIYINKSSLNVFLIFVLSQTASLVPIILDGSINIGAGLVRVEQYLIAGFLGVYLASQNIKRIRYLLFSPLVIGIIFASTLSLFQFLKGEDLGFWVLGERDFNILTPAIAKFDFYGQEFLRPYATFPHPNVLAGFMTVAIPIILLINKFINTGKSNFFSSLILILSGLTIFLTVSRTALVAFFIMGIIFLRRLGLMLFAIAVLTLSPFLYTRFSTIFSFDNLSLLRREELVTVAIDLFKSSPIFGVGLNNFIPAAADKLLVGPSRFLQPAHNIYLLELSETGIVGFLGFMALVTIPIFFIFKSTISRDSKFLILSSWFTFLFLGLFDHYFLTLPQGYRTFFLLWGITFSMLEWKKWKITF